MKRVWMTVLCGTAMTGGCFDPEDGTAAETSATSQPSIVQIGNIPQNGTLVSFDDITPTGGINLQHVVGLTACDSTALYAVEQDGAAYSLWFSNDSGQTWANKGAGVGREIACDHAQLATIDGNGALLVAALHSVGSMDPWVVTPNSVVMARIQGGDGTFYGTRAHPGGGYDVYVSSNHATSDLPTWGSPIATIGANQVTGTGTIITGTDHRAVGNSLAWSRRAYALEPTGTIDTNPTLLAGANSWGGLDTGSERYTTLTAAAPNILFGLENKSGTIHLGRIRIGETSCFDGIDNDGNGLTDAEDPACLQTVATSFCASQADGNYCANRFEPSTFLDQPNQNSALVHCATHVATAITPGVCFDNPSGTGMDSLTAVQNLTPEPAGTGHYCNVHWPDGTWDFGWTGSTPCTTLLAEKPNGKIVRAGLYSTTGANNIFVQCSNGSLPPGRATGVAPLASAYSAVGHQTNSCIFMVSPDTLPFFNSMFTPADYVSGRTTNPFDHTFRNVDLAQFGHGQTGQTHVDRFGLSIGPWENANDIPLDEGRPLYAVSGGQVITNGSRIRNIASQGIDCNGTPNQGELYVQYTVGGDPTYRETFVVYYAHVRKRLVVDGQVVKQGQILGYVGATGCTGGFGHLHAGVFRNSNTNAHTATAPELGYHVNFQANLDFTGTNTGGLNSVDPLGWGNTVAFDPYAYLEWSTDSGRGFLGEGAWSLDLFQPGKEFKYP